MKKLHKYLFLLAIVVFLITALFSKGFHHFDEHFQILEFASSKTGMTTTSDLPWEYESKIRPTLQPIIAVGGIKIMQTLGISSPFTQATIFRILAGLFSLFCIYYLIKALLPSINTKYQSLFVFFSFLLYFIPYIAVRFSSETFSACFFVIALALTIQKYHSQEKIGLMDNLLIGILLGLSFVLRYQAAFLILGLLLWLLIIKKIGIKKILSILMGIVLSVLIGILIDYWFYGGFVLTAWNYFDINILQDRAAQWGIHPYYYYSLLIGVGMGQIINYIILVLAIFYLIFNLKNPILWSIIPFLLAHSIVGHKELRFIFPIVFFIPYIIVMGWQSIMKVSKNSIVIKTVSIVLLIPLIGINLLLLFSNIIKPADGQVLVYEYVYNNRDGKKTIYYLDEKYDFYLMQGLLKMNYYNPYQYEVKKLDSKDINILNQTHYIIAKRNTSITNLPFKEVYQVIPDWMWNINKNNWMQIKNSNWVVYEVK